MRLTILEVGRPPKPLREAFPDYPAMFRGLFEKHADWTYETIQVVDGVPLPDPRTLDAALITGSPAGVYDDEPWIAGLLDFIRAAAEAKVPVIGICFGHQAIAQALGGKVEKSDKGWGVGRHVYEVAERPSWMADAPASFALAASHQDQVIALPPGAQVIARSPHTEFAGLLYEDARALTFQGHPEMDVPFTRALIDGRRGRIDSALVDQALTSLEQPLDADRVAGWIARFLERA
jgi:GMP synthase-like glutamine amidotransferase